MDDQTTESALSLTKFGVGQPVRRTEDPKLVRGEGCYTDDLNRPGQAYAVMVRSRDAHGAIRSIDTANAKTMPGVLAVYTAADLAAYGPLKCGLPLKNRDGSPIRYTARPALAGDKVRFVGDRLCGAPSARWRQGPLRGRSGRGRDCRDSCASQGCRRSGDRGQ